MKWQLYIRFNLISGDFIYGTVRTGWQKYSGTQILLTWRWDLRHKAKQVETLYTRRNSHFDVNIICVPEYFCHPVHFGLRERGEGVKKIQTVCRRHMYVYLPFPSISSMAPSSTPPCPARSRSFTQPLVRFRTTKTASGPRISRQSSRFFLVCFW